MIRACSALLVVAAATVTPTHADEPKRPPNIVIVFTDDLGYADIGSYGAKGYATPHLDRLASRGVRFTDFYVAQAVCSASRTALLTGCYPNRIGILGALGPSSRHGIHDDEETLAELLKKRGYATAIYGKWHLGHQLQFLPTRHGFDDYFGLPYSNDMWPKHPTSKFPDLPLVETETTIELNPDQRHLTTWYTQRAVKFIDANHDRPFLLYVPHSMPHVPLFVSDKYHEQSGAGLYGDVIAEIDWSVGQIVETLERHKLIDDTLVIFTSDNGPWLSYGNHGGSAGELREGKGTTFEGGVRVPCIMSWPSRIPEGSVCRQPAMTIDILPTVAKLVGVEPADASRIDGKDISALLLRPDQAKSPHDALFFYWGQELQAVRSGKWKLHFPHSYRTLKDKPGADGQPGPYVEARTELALYDLDEDVSERTNVADRHPEVVAELQQLAERARADLGDSAQKRTGKNVRSPGRI